MTTFLIPLTNIPQQFNIALAGKEYNLTSKWNDADEAGWVLDIADALTGLPIVCNIPLIVGSDLLSGLEYLGINGSLYVLTDSNKFAVPTFLNLGIESNLYYLTSVANG
jgi:hypothetical protein